MREINQKVISGEVEATREQACQIGMGLLACMDMAKRGELDPMEAAEALHMIVSQAMNN